MKTGLLQTLVYDIAGVTNVHYERWAENAGCIMKQNPHCFLDDIDTVVPVHVNNNHYVRRLRIVQLDLRPSQHAICGQ